MRRVFGWRGNLVGRSFVKLTYLVLWNNISPNLKALIQENLRRF